MQKQYLEGPRSYALLRVVLHAHSHEAVGLVVVVKVIAILLRDYFYYYHHY